MIETSTTPKISKPSIEPYGSIKNPRVVNGARPMSPAITISRQNPDSKSQYKTQIGIIAFIDSKATSLKVTVDTDNNVYIDFNCAKETPELVTIYNIGFDFQANLKGKLINVYVRNLNKGNSTVPSLGDGDPETSRGTETTVQSGIGEEQNTHI